MRFQKNTICVYMCVKIKQMLRAKSGTDISYCSTVHLNKMSLYFICFKKPIRNKNFNKMKEKNFQTIIEIFDAVQLRAVPK